MSKKETEVLLIKETDVLKMLSISRTTLWKRVKSGDIPSPIFIGAAKRLKKAEIEAAFSCPGASRG